MVGTNIFASFAFAFFGACFVLEAVCNECTSWCFAAAVGFFDAFSVLKNESGIADTHGDKSFLGRTVLFNISVTTGLDISTAISARIELTVSATFWYTPGTLGPVADTVFFG